jgi:hypothetical protein
VELFRACPTCFEHVQRSCLRKLVRTDFGGGGDGEDKGAAMAEDGDGAKGYADGVRRWRGRWRFRADSGGNSEESRLGFLRAAAVRSFSEIFVCRSFGGPTMDWRRTAVRRCGEGVMAPPRS